MWWVTPPSVVRVGDIGNAVEKAEDHERSEAGTTNATCGARQRNTEAP